jgi:ADP-dependent NAD(P)H-hydrate dehydratase / NAD(P)H-hydrate epimerase
MADEFSIPEQCRISTSEQSRDLDSQTINNFGIDGFTLMEMAASGAASHIAKMKGVHCSGLYICGKGNNAGDALAVARYLINNCSHSVHICFIFGDDDLSPDAEHNLMLLNKLRKNGADVRFVDNLESVHPALFDYAVDGIFGTGLKSDLRKPLPGIINQVNALNIPVYAMDVPSGLNADTGQIHKAGIRAEYTFTFGTNKIGFYLNGAKTYTGEIVYIPLPFPSYLNRGNTYLINQLLYNALPIPKREAKHKYDGGVVHIMAGSEGLTGAAIMAAKSAWKQGAGSVFLYAPKKILPVYEAALPQIIKIGLGSEDDSYYKEDHSPTIIKSIQNKKGVLMAGPGIGTHPQTGTCLHSVLRNHTGHAILDADGLAFWNDLKAIPDQQKAKWLLTPHIGEAGRYLDGSFSDDHERLHWSASFTEKHSCSILMKGNPSILCSPSVGSFITEYDTSVFSRAGFGDVLSGTISALTGITDNITIAAVNALYTGYMSYQKTSKSKLFAPEDLL